MSSKAEPEVPVPLEHRGRARVKYVEDHDIRYLIDLDNPDAWLSYSGCISEVVI